VERNRVENRCNELDDVTCARIDRGAARAARTFAVVIVHGGGKAIAPMQERLNCSRVLWDGCVWTDDESLDVAEM